MASIIKSTLVQSKSMLLEGEDGFDEAPCFWVRDMAYCRLAGASEQMSEAMDSLLWLATQPSTFQLCMQSPL